MFPNAGVGEIGEWLVDDLDKDGELVVSSSPLLSVPNPPLMLRRRQKPALLTVKINLLGAAQSESFMDYLAQNPTHGRTQQPPSSLSIIYGKIQLRTSRLSSSAPCTRTGRFPRVVNTRW